MEKDLAYKEAEKRGWFSYTELACLMDTVRLTKVIHAFVNISSICLATYAAGVVTLLGSALVASQVPGTSLAPRQSAQSNDTTTTPYIRTQTLTIPIDYLQNNYLDCNDTSETINNDDATTNIQSDEWQWWLSSLITWLPKYLESDLIIPTEHEVDKLHNPEIFITNSQSSLLHNQRALDDIIVEINWKETLGTNSDYPKNHWGYYANYLGKVSLSHRH